MACRRRRCRENKADQRAAAVAAANAAKAKLDQGVISVPGESARLWSHVTFGTGTCVGMIEGYATLEMPGNPLPAIIALRDRLNQVIATLEARNADPVSQLP